MSPLSLIVILVLVCAVLGQNSLYVDYVQCVEQRQCGLTSVCSFLLPVPSSLAPETNKSDITGYIMHISNGLEKTINLTWDVLGNPGNTKTTFSLDGHTSRYINTHYHDVHTIRLQVRNDTADTEIANPEFVCTADQACEYLVRSCFANNDDPLCKEYAIYCQATLKYTTSHMDTYRQACIPNCLAEFYDAKIADPYRYTSDEIVAKVSSSYRSKVVIVDETGLPAGLIVTIVLGVALVLIGFIVGLFVYIRYRRNRIGHL